jgi:hypothetical protein
LGELVFSRVPRIGLKGETVMPFILTVNLPEGTSLEEGEALQQEIKGVAEVKASGVQETRSVLAAVAIVTIWLNLAKPAMEVISKIIDLIRVKGLKDVVIELPNNGGSIKIDSASVEDIEKLLKVIHEHR